MEPRVRITILDRGGTLAELVGPPLREAGYRVGVTGNGQGAVDTDLLILDGCSLGPEGIPRIISGLRRSLTAPILQVSGCPVLEAACRCHPIRADAFLLRPFRTDELLSALARLTTSAGGPPTFHGMVGSSDAMARVFEAVRLVAPAECIVLVSGETGTGKERVARAVHALSPRADGPFVTVDCAALPPSLLESELFGHVRGAFTGAIRDKAGLFAASDQGTLFLDEVGDMPISLQSRLLRVVEEREVRPVGSTTTVRVDNRIVAATRRDLPELVARGAFREDLYFRLKGFEIDLPPLRERRDDIGPLVRWWFRRHRPSASSFTDPPMTEPALGLLQSHPWPGNVRELFAVLEHASIRSEGLPLGVEHLPAEVREAAERSDPEAYRSALARGRTADDGPEAILAALHESGGHRASAAERLGISRTTLWRRMKRLGLDGDGALPSR